MDATTTSSNSYILPDILADTPWSTNLVHIGVSENVDPLVTSVLAAGWEWRTQGPGSRSLDNGGKGDVSPSILVDSETTNCSQRGRGALWQ